MTITEETAASFSKFAYEGSTFVLPQSWSNAGWDVILQGNRTDGYHGKVFVKIDSATNTATELVIAHRGTEPTDVNDLLADVQLALSATAQQVDEAETFIGEAQSAYLQYLNDEGITGGAFNTITTNVGHSLGGYLAIHAADHMEDQTPNSGKAIVFDNPATDLGNTNANIDNYLNHANHINKAGGSHLGDIYRIQDRDFRFSSEDKASIVNTMVAAVDTALMIVNGPAEFLDTLSAGLTGGITDWALLPTSAANTLQEHSIDSIIARLDSAQLETATYNTSAIETFLIGDYASTGTLGGIINEYWSSDFDDYGLTKTQLGDALVAVFDDPSYDPATNTTYFVAGSSGDNTLVGSADSDVILAQDGDDNIDASVGNHIVDAGDGNDTITYENLVGPTGVNVDLGSGNTYVGAITGQPKDSFAHVENVIGSDYADVILGDGANNTLTGGEGDDELDGGSGVDYAVFSGDVSDYTIVEDAATQRVTVTDNRSGSPDGVDELKDIEFGLFNGVEHRFFADPTHPPGGPGGGGGNSRTGSTPGQGDAQLNLSSDAYLSGDDLFYDVSVTHGAGVLDATESNIVIILDNSLSLSGAEFAGSKSAAKSYIDAVEAASGGGANNYAVVKFAGTASTTGNMTAAEAKAHIDSLGQDNGTNYANALNAAADYLEGKSETAVNSSLFLSDGEDVGDAGERATAAARLQAVSTVKSTGFGGATTGDLDDLDNTSGSQIVGDEDGDGDVDGDDIALVFADPGLDTSTVDRIDIAFDGQVKQTILPGAMNDGLHGVSASGSVDISGVTPSTAAHTITATLVYSDGSPSVTVSLPVSFGQNTQVSSVGDDDIVLLSAAAAEYDAGAGDDEIFANGYGNELMGGEGNDTISAAGGDDTLRLGTGHNLGNGGDGSDAAHYDGNYADYTISKVGDVVYVQQDADTVAGTLETYDTLLNTEFLQFADGVVSVEDVTQFLPTLTVSDVSIGEVSSGTSSGVVTFTLSEAHTEDVTFDYATADFTATSSSDYTSRSGSITIAAGELTASIVLRVDGDAVTEGNESFRVNVTNLQEAVFADLGASNSAYVGIVEGSTSANADPIAVDDAFTLDENQPTILTIFANDTDAEDVAFDASNITILTNPTHGVLSFTIDGTLLYTPDTGYNGTDSFTYELVDSNGATAVYQPTVNLTIQSIGLVLTHEGDAGNNSIVGSSADDVILGNAGNDTLKGSSGADTLMGAAGDDIIYGYKGNDTYVWKGGDGNDTFIEQNKSASSADIIKLTGGITLADIDIYGFTSHDLKIVHSPTGETLTIQDQYYNDSDYQIESIAFDDGSTLNLLTGQEWRGDANNNNLDGSVYADTLLGKAGNDTLEGRQGHDTLEGGLGDDVLYGYTGNDTYVWQSGDGNDIFIEQNYSASTGDVLKLTGGITLADIDIYGFTSYDLKIIYTPTGETLTIQDQYYNDSDYQIESIAFDDGSTLNLLTGQEWRGDAGQNSIVGSVYADTLLGNAGNDTLKGSSGADTLEGGLGDDVLYGYTGNDTYVWQSGDGNDIFIEQNYSASTGDVLKLTGGITLADLDIYGFTSYDLKIVHSPTGETLTIQDQYYNDSDYQIESIAFDDGSTYDLLQGVEWRGDANNNNLDGSVYADTLLGNDGNDTLEGRQGHDTLEGGLGDDVLYGYTGNDTYVWQSGDGNDIFIEQNYSASTGDVVHMTGGIVAADVSFSQSGNDLLITHIPSGAVITIDNQYSSDTDYHIETLLFDDASTINLLGV